MIWAQVLMQLYPPVPLNKLLITTVSSPWREAKFCREFPFPVGHCMAKAARQIALRKRKVRGSSATVILDPVWHIVLKLRTCINFAVPSGGVETTGYTLECNIKPKPGEWMPRHQPHHRSKIDRSCCKMDGRACSTASWRSYTWPFC